MSRLFTTTQRTLQSDEPKLGLSDFFWDRNYYLGKSPTQQGVIQREYPVAVPLTGLGCTTDLCFIYDCMYRKADQLNGTTKYYQLWNNSNTFLTQIMTACGVYAKFPPSGTAGGNNEQRNTMYCMEACLGLIKNVYGPATKQEFQECARRCKGLDPGDYPTGTEYNPW